jgi:hypothetical protein
MVQALRAETVAESALTRIAATVNRRPWETRFLQDPAVRGALPDGPYVFDERRVPFVPADALYPETRFTGSIRDVSATRRRYRVRISVWHQDLTFRAVYDMKYSEGVLGASNRDLVLRRQVTVDPATPEDEIDAQVASIDVEAHSPGNLLEEPTEAVKLPGLDPEDPRSAEGMVPVVAAGAPMIEAFEPKGTRPPRTASRGAESATGGVIATLGRPPRGRRTIRVQLRPGVNKITIGPTLATDPPPTGRIKLALVVQTRTLVKLRVEGVQPGDGNPTWVMECLDCRVTCPGSSPEAAPEIRREWCCPGGRQAGHWFQVTVTCAGESDVYKSRQF